uniref:Cytochrome b n=1 Tax=Epanerchodus koreanus TaxID=2678661 RepID=A0A7L8HYX3_9MYRI|nr:cytochrome b [Epanerchodus koreanus]QOE55888.1 cytochrome b [Epanerchodus koreanus]
MNKSMVFSVLNSFLIDLPTPVSISYLWNFGSLLAFSLMVQLFSGIFLSFHYTANVDMAFYSVIHLTRDVSFGWILHFMHANGASMFFIFLYLHIGRGLYYSSYNLIHVWLSGLFIFLIVMMTAFLGYVLPWGQMSFWGATVITNLVSAIPYFGESVVLWLWGGFSVDNPTLVRFFSFHFFFPFIISALVMVHLLLLHETGSSMPGGLDSDLMKVEFHPYFSVSDFLGLIFLIWFFMMVIFFYPNYFGDCENFISANSLVTPNHIQPEWYFLFAYAILRSIPNSFGGVLALLMSVLVFSFCFFFVGYMKSSKWSIIWRFIFWWFIFLFFMLTWIGARGVFEPYVTLGQIFSFMYFLVFIMVGFFGNMM